MNNNNTSKTKKGFMKSRGAKRASLSILFTVIFIAAVILLNVVVSAVDSQHSLSLDVTANSSYQLQESSVEYLKSLDKDVDIYILEKEDAFESGDSNNYKYYVQANKLIHAIAESSDHITLHYIDLAANPTFTADYPQVDWTKSHIALVTSGDLYRAIDQTDMFSFDEEQYSYYGTLVITDQRVEQSILTAIMNVTTEDKIKVSVLSGQGEQDMTPFTTLLENNGYEIEQVSLLTGSISEDSTFAIIYDPDVDIDENIYTTLSEWLNNDGKFGHHLFYFPNDQHNITEFPNLNALLADYGMKVRYGYVYENDSNYLIPNYNHYYSIFDYSDDTTYTDDLRNKNIPVVMSLTMPIDITDDQMATALLYSSDKAYFIPRDLMEDENAAASEDFKPDAEKLTGAAIGQRNDGTEDGKDSSIVVIGSYDAVTTNYLSIKSYNNAAYFVNLFNTLGEREDMSVIIEGKNPSATELGVTSNDSIAFPAIIVRFIIPIGVLLAGIIIWIIRRFK